MDHLCSSLTERQKRIFDWISRNGQHRVFAEAYAGAAIALRDQLPGFVTFVSHFGRDFINIYPSSIANGGSSSRVDYHKIVSGLEPAWTSGHPLQGSKELDSLIDGVIISNRSHSIVTELVEEHIRGTSQSENRIELFFTALLDYTAADEVPPNVSAILRGARKWFMEHVHCRPGSFPLQSGAEANNHFTQLENLLDAAARSQYTRMTDIDGIVEETNRTDS